MSATNDISRVVRSWIREEEHDSADRILEVVLSRLDSTPQRRSWWPARRPNAMSNPLRIALAAATVAAIAILGYSLIPGVGDTGGRPTPAPSTVQQVSPSARSTSGPGTATVMPFAPGLFEMCPPAFISSDCTEDPRDDSMTFTFDVPEGWEADHAGADLVDEGIGPPAGANMLIARGNWLYSDPCRPDDSIGPDVEVGPTVADFVTALDTHPLLDVTPPIDVTIAGYPAKYLDLQVPSDLSECFRYRPIEGTLYAQGPGQRWHFWVFEVDGIRVTAQTFDYPGTSARHQAELRAIVESIQVTP